MAREPMRKLVPGLAAVALVASLFLVAQSQVAVAGVDEAAARYRFDEMPIAMPPGYENQPMNTVRQVNPAYQHIRAWISSVGASIAVNDLTGHGRADGMCIVDTRTDRVVVTYTPTATPEDLFTPFVLDPTPLPMDSRMAPTGCTPGDFNDDGRMDLLVTYWGRTPVLFLARSTAAAVSPSAYRPQELVPQVTVDGNYHGRRWNTDAVSVGDFDGDGRPDIFVANYFPDSDVLDPHGENNVQMNNTLSGAGNGGGAHVLRRLDATSGPNPTVAYVEETRAVPFSASTGWTLAVSGADLTGDGLPELYVANDFGHDHLLYNVSTRGHIHFTVAVGQRTPTTPKSFVLGKDSFKGMGIDFGDLNNNGTFDMMVSNITTAWGLQESNFVWMNQAKNDDDMRRKLGDGVAPFTQEAQQFGMAWTGWGWDLKMADFLNSGHLDVVQTDGFVKGEVDRWNWLQEMAMTNDDLLSNPAMWPNVAPGDDVAGRQAVAFYARNSDGRYVNISSELGIAAPIPTRGVATADTTGRGATDFALARQWGPPVFYANDAPNMGGYLELRLYRPSVDGDSATGLAGVGTPAYGATVWVTTADGHTQVSQLDGGGGHGGKRSFDVHFGLGPDAGPATVRLAWRDTDGQPHQQTRQLLPGIHTLVLTGTAREVPNR